MDTFTDRIDEILEALPETRDPARIAAADSFWETLESHLPPAYRDQVLGQFCEYLNVVEAHAVRTALEFADRWASERSVTPTGA